MSEAMGSSTETSEVYVPLLDEGTDVRRPTRAVPCGEQRYRLLATEDYDPDDEHWSFPPGSIVECHFEDVEGRNVLVAHAKIG
jgi:hypothetical protein